MNRVTLYSGCVSLLVTVFLSCFGRAATAGGYADGLLLLHGSPLTASSDPADYQNFLQIASCEEVVAQLPEGPGAPGQGRVAYVLAVFLPESYVSMYFRDDADCPPDACQNPVGACCLPSGDCGEMLRYQCDVFSGDYRGDGSICDPVHCEIPPIAPTEQASWGAIKVRYR